MHTCILNGTKPCITEMEIKNVPFKTQPELMFKRYADLNNITMVKFFRYFFDNIFFRRIFDKILIFFLLYLDKYFSYKYWRTFVPESG